MFVTRDPDGRPTKLHEGERPVARCSWWPDGTLARVETQTGVLSARYYGSQLSELSIAPATGSATGQERCIVYDDLGRLRTIREVSGADQAETMVEYDKVGRLTQLRQSDDEVRISWDAEGRLQSLRSSSGRMVTCLYRGSDDAPEQVTVRKDGSEETIRMEGGRPIALRQFDGGAVKFNYRGENGAFATELAEISLPNGLVLAYASDEAGQWRSVTCGSGRFDYRFDASGRLVELSQAPATRQK
jgi:YD repeat-containing protein